MKAKPILMLAGAAALGGCVPQVERPPQPVEAPPVQAAPPAPPPAAGDWRDIPLTPGNWYYGAEASGGSAARFGAPETEAIFVIRCEPSRQVRLSVEGEVRGALTIRTTFGARSLPLTVEAQPIAYSHATLAATDPLLDQIAFSRGRFSVEAPGQQRLILPAWAEPARVIEDCRS